VDIISHLAFGRVLLPLLQRPAIDRGLSAAVVIGSIAPDVDAVLMPTGWDRYLLWHQRGTHALVGTMIDAIVLAAILRFVLRAPPAARFQHLAFAAWVGCLGHILLDLISGGTIRVFAPFWTTAFGVAWMEMADPMLAIPIVSAAIAMRVWRARAWRIAIATLLLLAAIVGVKELSRQRALHAYQQAIASRGEATTTSSAIEAAWGSMTRWWVFDHAGRQLRVWEVDARRGDVRLRFARDASPANGSPKTMELIEKSEQLETVRHVHQVFDVPSLTLVELRANGSGTDVLWSDIRFCGPSFCALWFGGSFDASGCVREEVVIIGTVRQTRAPAVSAASCRP
jgi:membrane-bound metal-dependent hydrolase YbcI (DUF457 family)